mmetsp:Transcript_28299/g.21149  ORF Transcript_28299/g.21149 Transcript_28299/m.21149 type:complete len:80 (+) Transcript_28299:1368-1607(+)
MKVMGPAAFSMMASFNFSQTTQLYYDFTHCLVLAVSLVVLAYLVTTCLDKDWKTPELEKDAKNRLRNGVDSFTYPEVFA